LKWSGELLKKDTAGRQKCDGKCSRKNHIFVIASEAKQSKTVCFLRLLRPKGLAMTQKRIIFCAQGYCDVHSGLEEKSRKICVKNGKYPGGR